MISFETFLALIVTILTSGLTGTISYYAKAKTSETENEKALNWRIFKIILGFSVLLAVGIIILYRSDEFFSFLSKSRLFPFYQYPSMNWRFTFSYILGIIFSIIALAILLRFFHANFLSKLSTNIVVFIFVSFLIWELIWANYFISLFATANFCFDSNLLFMLFTVVFIILALFVILCISVIVLGIVMILCFFLAEMFSD